LTNFDTLFLQKEDYMEPFEWLVLGIGLVLGGLFGSKGKGIVKSAAKGYLVVGEKAKTVSANLREDFRDALEEARYEQEREEALREQAEYETELAHAAPKTKAKAPSNSTRKAAPAADSSDSEPQHA
jgi:hypothetical protein